MRNAKRIDGNGWGEEQFFVDQAIRFVGLQRKSCKMGVRNFEVDLVCASQNSIILVIS